MIVCISFKWILGGGILLDGFWQEPKIRHPYGGVYRTEILGEVEISRGLVMLNGVVFHRRVGEKVGFVIFKNGEILQFPNDPRYGPSFMSLCARGERIRPRRTESDEDGDLILDPLRRLVKEHKSIKP